MNDLLQLVIQHLRGMWNRRWVGLAAAWLALIIGIAYAMQAPERYEATARVYVDTQSLLRPVMAGLSIQPNLEQQASLVSRTLISRPNIEKLASMSNLSWDTRSVKQRDELVDSILRTLQLTGDAKTNSYVISFRDTSPHRAQNVVQSLLKIFLDSSLGDKREDTRNALQFLDEQIQRYEVSLQAAESRLKDFKLKYMGISGQGGQGGQDFFARMAKLSDDITAARLELRSAAESRDAYRRALAAESSTIPSDRALGATPMQLTGVEIRLAAQRAKLDELLRSFTEQHPDVVGTRRVIAELESQRVQEEAAKSRAAAAAGRPSDAVQQNPVFQKMRVSLADAEANVASLSAKLASYEGQYAGLKSSARMVPQVEAEFAQLNRDYDIQKKTYSDLLLRREAATLGADVQSTDAAQFRVIDPPRVSSQPVPPTRLQLLALAFVAALGVGLAASFAANELQPTIHDLRSLRETSERPVLGSLTLVSNAATSKKRRRNLMFFVGGLGTLFATFAGILVFALTMVRAS